ncbi:hypothetical protein [Bradyrhizobium barranii]|uniref:hypothetical protein n=1 Tax=Bradyrhizobium barranii TaxID=2992140 RepID=UPI0032E38731
MSRKMRGSVILCATIRNSHSWSTESKKLRMSASSTQLTPLAHDRRVQGVKRHMRIPPRPKAVGEPEEVGLVDGAQHLGYRALDNLVL